MNNQCNYQQLSVIGEGAFGKAYLVRNKKGEYFAYKTIFESYHDEDIIYKIINPIELDILFRLQSPHLLKGIDISLPGECTNEFGIVSKLIRGDLFKILYKMNFERKKKVMYEITKAVQCLHTHNYLHLDIKLDNIRYEQDDNGINAVLLDYGGCSYTPCGVKDGIFTRTPRFTFDYTSPEGCIANKKELFHYTEKNDVWALGITFFEILGDGYFEFIPNDILNMFQNEDPEVSDLSFEELSKFLKSEFSSKNIQKVIDKYTYDYIEKQSDRNQFGHLIKQILKIRPSDRFDITQILKHPFFDSVKKTSECLISKPENISLSNLTEKELNKVVNLVKICNRYVSKESVCILFMAVDILLRVLHKGLNLPNLELTSLLISIKYFYWSENDGYLDLLEKFQSQENMIYKILEGKIKQERYFENCRSIDDIKFIYNHFIKSKNNTFNPNLVDYLNYDANEFITTHSKIMRVNSKKEMFDFKIKELN
jgi:serine/threonine protein kinase